MAALRGNESGTAEDVFSRLCLLQERQRRFLFCHLINSDKGEEWVIGNFKLKLMKYYRSIEAWKEATDKLE